MGCFLFGRAQSKFFSVETYIISVLHDFSTFSYAAIVTMNRNVPAMMIIQIFVPVPFQSNIRDILQLCTSLCLTDSYTNQAKTINKIGVSGR